MKDFENELMTTMIDEGPSIRLNNILTIYTQEKLEPSTEGVTLNEGYQFEVNSTLPEIADGIAKMAAEMDKEEAFGTNGGKYFLHLVADYYDKLKLNNGRY